jgi:hypothetical protein
MVRKAICAGTWYPKEKKEIEKYLDLKAKKEKVIASICPHAGWIYSGKVAGAVYSKIAFPDVTQPIFVLIGPNHTGLGEPASIMRTGEWEMPLGKVKIADELANAILENSQILEDDPDAHSQEHSLEVQIPFIQYFFPEAQIVPIGLSDYRLSTCQDIGEAIAIGISKEQRANSVIIVASTDMTHYESQKNAERKDKLAIDKILQFDPEGLMGVVRKENISMCGSGPIATVLYTAKKLGAKSAELILYQTSGDTTGDYSAVVGYAGLIIK